MTGRARFALVMMAGFVCSCAAAPSPSTPQSRSSAASTASTAEPQLPPCEQAAKERSRAHGLLRTGKLQRTLRVIDKANRLCPATRASTWQVEVETLAEIGRYEAALALANTIDASAEAPSEAAGRARARVGTNNRSFPDTNEAKADMRKHWREAQQAARAGKHTQAKDLYLQAWSEWRPNGGALYGAGRSAKLAGDAVGAQRLFDRAIEDLERTTGKALALDTRNGLAQPIDAAWSPDGRLLVVADGKDLAIVSAATGRERMRLGGHKRLVVSVAVAPDGATLASASLDKTVRLWNSTNGKLLRTLEGHEDTVWSVAFSPDGAMLASASGDKTVRLWIAATGKLLRKLEGHAAAVRSVAFSPDGGMLASASSDKSVRFWRTSTGEPVHPFTRSFGHHSGEVMDVVFSPDGAKIASASLDKTVRLWPSSMKVLSREVLRLDGRIRAVAFSADGARFALTYGNNVTVVRSSNIEGDWPHIRRYLGQVRARSVAFSPDGATLAAVFLDREVRLWSSSNGKLLRTLEGHSDKV